MKPTQLSFAFLLIASTLLSSCSFFQNCEEGVGEIIELEIDLEEFSVLNVDNNVTVFLTQSPQQQVKIKAQENLINLLNTEINGDDWDIRFSKCVKPSDPIEIYIDVKELSEININGSGNVLGKSIFSNDDLELTISGSGSIRLPLAVKELSSEIAGSGEIILEGNTKSHDIEINGSGDVMAFDLVSDVTEIEINGSGDVKVNTSYALEVEINGSGDVYYKGNVKQISSEINGSGNLHQHKD